MAAINIDVGANTRQAERDIQKLVSRSYNINLKTKGDQPLGRITGKVNEFTKSLDASNARVIAFGASAGIIFGVERAFQALVSSVIDTQKALADINVILNVSSTQLNKFGSSLFSIAKNTGQSFQEVAKAATEFSRQGLGVEETLKRTNEALILSRLSGLDAAKSVEALTASVNSFANQAVTATEIVNKFANVDAAFAVSSADLAEAISRVGSSASQSGVSLNELIAIVTSAQQTTARGGAVIGNSFKTIFTRLQRTKTIDLLESLGVNTRDASGEVKSTINLLTDLAKVYDQLGTLQQAEVAEKVGGVFQINILKAALADLGKEYSVYNNALNVAASTTDQAIRRNEELNKTYAAQLNALRENATQLGAGVGERLFGPAFDRIVGNANELLGGINESDGQGVGAVLGKGILDGLGQVIAGPGLALIGGIFIKLFSDLSKFATGSIKELLGLNTASKQQQALQQSIASILQKNPELFKLMQQGAAGLNKGAEILLTSLRAQTLELQKQEAISAKIAAQFLKSGNVRIANGVPVAPTLGKPGKAAGYIPNFAEELQAKELGAKSNVKAVRGMGKIGGKSFEANNQEFQLKNFAGTGETAVIPKYGNGIKEAAKMIARGESGSVLDKNDRNKAKGFVPNFASVENIARLNKRVAERLSLSQSPRGDGRLQNEDLVNISGRAFKQKQFPIDPKETFKKYESRVLQQSRSLLGKNYRSGEELRFVTSAAVDGYNISQKGDETVIDLLEVKGGKNWSPTSVLNKFLRAVPENYLSNNPLDVFKKVRDKITVGATLVTPYTKERAKPTQDKLLKKRFVKAAAGFIPNFAQGKNAIDLGDTRTSPALKGKVLSLIHPGISQGYSMTPATASYLGQQYKGLIPVAGINQQVIKGQLPDLDKNLGDLLVREANQFGQVIGGGNFLKSAQDLPNFGAAKGAVGVAFEGGLLTLLRQNLQKTAQNAGIDFRQNRITPKLRNLFHGAPGMYDAKYSPELVNDVMSKLLQEAKVGEVKKVKSGPGYKDYDEQRKSALNYIRSLPPSEQPRRGNALEAAIRKRIAEQTRLKGMAAGYIPNFASAMSVAKKTENKSNGNSGAQLVKNSPIGPFIKTPGQSSNLNTLIRRDHPEGLNAALQTSFTNQKMAAGGFIPNFAAEDTTPADTGATLAALSAQLLGVGLLFQGAGQQYKSSLEELTQENIKNAKVQKRTAQERRAIFDQELKAGKTTEEAARTANYAPGRGQKIGAAFSANALGIGFAAPIIAETIANAIGKETKEARTGGAAVSAIGQAASFAAFGSMFGPWGTAIGAATGATLGFVDVIKQASTDVPEMAEAARKASENLTRVNDASQKVQTGFEQIKQLRESGQAEKAGQLEAELLGFIRKEFKDTPQVSAQLQSSVINQNLTSLQEAIGKNTDAVIKNSQAQSENLLLTELKETFGTEASGARLEELIKLQSLPEDILDRLVKISGFAQDLQERRNKRAGGGGRGYGDTPGQNFISDELNNIFNEIERSGIITLDRLNTLKNLFKTNPGAGIIELAKIFGPASQILEAAKAAARQTRKGNKIIDIILTTFEQIQSNYKKLASQTQSAFNLQLTGQAAIRTAKSNIKVSDLEREGLTEELFAIPKRTGQLDKGTEAQLTKINDEFANNIQNSIDSIIKLVADEFISSLRKSTTEEREGLSSEENVKANFEITKDLINQLKNPQTGELNTDFLEKIRKILDIGDIESFQGFNVPEKLEEIAKELNLNLQNPKDLERLNAIEEALFKTNAELINNKAILIEQKRILANQKFGENLRELITSLNSAFGGLQAFINNDTSISSALNKAIANLKNIGQPTGEKSFIEVGRNLQRVLSELSRIIGKNIGPALGENSQIIKGITDARALDIQKELKNIIKGVGGLGGKEGQELIRALIETLRGMGIANAENLSLPELIQAFSRAVAERQVQTENQVGKIDQAIIDQAKANLPPELQKALGNIDTQFLPVEKIIQIQFAQANKTLLEILSVLTGGESELEAESQKSKVDNAASGVIPSKAIPAMIAETRAIKDGVGGARLSDLPKVIRNFNGSMVVANEGEKLMRNFMGTGQDALLTRDMQNMAKGFLPKMNSYMAEMDAGFSPNEIYQKRQPEVQGLNNPEGFATFNKSQEGNIMKERMAMANRMYMPNFANAIPESTPASISLGGLTINEAQTGGQSKDYAADFAAEWEKRAGNLALEIKNEMDQKYGRSLEIVNAAERQNKLPRVPPRTRLA